MLVNSSSCKLSTESPTGVLNRDVFANFVHPNAKKAILVGKILNMTSHRNETFDSRHNLQFISHERLKRALWKVRNDLDLHSANELFKRTCSQSLQLPSSEATPGVFELYPTMKDLSINNETRDLNLNITQSMPVDEEVKWLGRNQISRNKCEQVLESNGATLSLSRPAESLNQPIKSKSIELASKQCEVLRQKAAQLLERIDRQEEQLKKKLILRTTSASSVSSSVCSSHSMSMSSLPACPPACLPVIHSCVVVPCAKERIDNSRDPSKTILNCRDDLRQPQLTHNRSSSLLEEDLLFNFLKMELELD